MDVKTKAYIKHGGQWYKNGEEIKDIKAEDGENLIARSLAFETESSVKTRQEAEETTRKAEEDAAKKEADDKAKADADAAATAKEKAKADKKGK